MITISRTSLFLAALFTFNAVAQYNINDRELVKATFLRDGSSPVIQDYLNSGDTRKVNAALLSAANINDTTLHPAISALDPAKYGKLVAFAFGNNSQSAVSLAWLRKQAETATGAFAREVIAALGKAGNAGDLELVLELKVDDDPYRVAGVSLAVANFALRSIKSAKSPEKLLKFVEQNYLDNKTRSFAAYALFRSRPLAEHSGRIKKVLDDVLRDDVTEEEEDFAKYLIMNLRYLKSAPYTVKETVNALFSLNFAQQIDMISLLQFRDFTSESEVNGLLKLVNDKNGNIALTAVTALRESNAGKFVSEAIYNALSSTISGATQSSDLAEELLKTVIKLFPDKRDEAFARFSSKLSRASYASLIASNPALVTAPFDTLVAIFNAGREPEKLAVATAMVDLKKFGADNDRINSFAFRELASGYPSVVATLCGVFDSSYIAGNKAALGKQILEVINEDLHNPNFLEAHQMLIELATKVEAGFKEEMKALLLNSAISSIRSLSGEKIKRELPNNFDEIWFNAFKYKRAVLETTSGNISLELRPDYAPVSAGNFVSLSQTSFYREVVFHRVVPAFVIQAGDPSGTGFGGPGYDIISELSPLEFTTGGLGMASAGKDTEGSQFFIMNGTYPHLTTRYTFFGRVTGGQDVADSITRSTVIKKISLFE